MSFWAHLTQAGLAATQAAAQHPKLRKAGKRAGKGKPECTPCAAQAYVDSLRGSLQGK